MPKRNRQAKKKLNGKGRLNDAKMWLENHGVPKEIIGVYAKRYAITENEAESELMSIGYYDDISIQHYEKNGIAWEYKYGLLSREIFVVPPSDTPSVVSWCGYLSSPSSVLRGRPAVLPEALVEMLEAIQKNTFAEAGETGTSCRGTHPLGQLRVGDELV